MGAIDKEKLRKSTSLAVDAYISNVNWCSFGHTVSQLYCESDVSQQEVVGENCLPEGL